ncbi:hypothetical protein Tco_1288865 [Tanacetum coccineum]
MTFRGRALKQLATNARKCKRKLHDIIFDYLISFLRFFNDESKSMERSERAFMDTLCGMIENLFAEYTGITVKQFKDKLIQHMENVKKSVAERTIHQRQYERRVNKRQMQTQESKIDSGSALDVVSSPALDADLVVMESNGTESGMHDTSSSSGNYITPVVDADIRPVNDQVPVAKVQLTAQHNVLANEQHHTDQCEPIYDTYLLEKFDSNTTPDSTNMCHRGGEIDQDAEQYQAKSPLLKAELLKMKDMSIENADLKAQIQEKVFANVALKNELRKLKGNSVDTMFAKPSILGKPVLQPLRNQSVVRQPNAFKSERPNFSKPRFASQVDVNNVLSKPVTPHYLPKVREYMLAKPHHVIVPGSSRNSEEESYGSNDMAYNHYLAEARKKTLERNRNSKPSVMPYVRLQNTVNGSTPNPKRTNQTSKSLPTSKSSCVTITVVPKADHSRNSSSFSDSKHFFCSTCHKCVFNENHDVCITKLLNEVNSRKIFLGHRYSPKKTSAMNKKTSPIYCLRWKPTGKIFTTAGLRWIPTGKMFTDSTTKVDSEPPNGSNEDITNLYEFQASILNVNKMTSVLISSGLALYRQMTSVHISSGLALQRQMASADNTSGHVP